MLRKLQAKWKVNGWSLLLIITTFALGGSLCGRLSVWIINKLPVETKWIELLLFVSFCTLLWPLAVLLVSIPLGQYSFFKKYINKIWNKVNGKHNKEISRIAIFASGAGTNAKNIIEYFKNNSTVIIDVIVCNKPGAGVIQIARDNNIDVLLTDKNLLINNTDCLPELKRRKIDFIVLAGFLLKIPPVLIQAFPNKMINIHPALLPAYGGKGMYGMHVHEAVISNKEKHSGISIHYVDELYDHGEIIFRATCDINPMDTPQSLAKKIHALEQKHYPVVIEGILKKQNRR